MNEGFDSLSKDISTQVIHLNNDITIKNDRISTTYAWRQTEFRLVVVDGAHAMRSSSDNKFERNKILICINIQILRLGHGQSLSTAWLLLLFKRIRHLHSDSMKK